LLRKSSRTRLWYAAATALAVLAAVGGTSPAYSDTVGGAISGSVNSSDPLIFQCPKASGAVGVSLCMYTSHDMGAGALPNYYPMDKTYLYRLEGGVSAADPAHWVGTQIVDESTQLACVPRPVFPCGAHHLWAPGGGYYNGKYLLYVPDLGDTSAAGQHTSSHIYLMSSTATTALGCCGPVNFVQNMPATPNSGYASDPSYFADSDANNYLLWANGDYDYCGGVSMGRLVNDWTVANGAGQVSIFNFADNLGACGSTGRPYIEGPELYRTTDLGGTGATYTMIFAAKPMNATAPTGCNSTNEVIAYATSNIVTGPYAYRGIIMCGSEGPDGGEWTNQASVAYYPYANRYVFAYHDGPHADGGATAWPNRKVHLQCLKWNAGKIVRIPRSSTNMSNC
jgi:beta-xylosidase